MLRDGCAGIPNLSRKIFMFKKANTTSMKEDLTKLSEDIVKKYHEDAVNTTGSLWNDFKTGLTTSIDKHIPSKMITSRSSGDQESS